jgi:flagellar motor protein MotB
MCSGWLSCRSARFDSPEPDPINQRIIKEFISDSLRIGVQIEVIGYQDVVVFDDRSLRLRASRANSVYKLIKLQAKPGIIASLVSIDSGESAPLYPNDLPEGRFYNRCVQVSVTTPNE